MSGPLDRILPTEPFRWLGHRLVVMSGDPAALGTPIPLYGPTPRAPDDAALLQTQGRLMRSLTGQLPP